MRLLILPIILGWLAYFIGPHHSFYVKGLMGIVIGVAIQHRHFVRLIDDMVKEIDKYIFEDD
ncbi:MAG: hypothetical protein K2F80_01655 [Muribaculaceae bacterium]|nr:hypothetical protein [Muribaculaceae bacterium]